MKPSHKVIYITSIIIILVAIVFIGMKNIYNVSNTEIGVVSEETMKKPQQNVPVSSEETVPTLPTTTDVPVSTNEKAIDASLIDITPISPANNAQWKWNSTQTISWSLKGLPQGKFNMVVSLVETGVPDALNGVVTVKPVKNGTGSASYRVGVIVVGGDAQSSLDTKKYKVIYSIYKTPDKPGQFANYGDLVTEKIGGEVEIVD